MPLGAKPSMDGRGVTSDKPSPTTGLSVKASGPESCWLSGAVTAGCWRAIWDVSMTRGFGSSGCCSAGSSLESRFSRAAPRPNKATFLKEPLRLRVFDCWDKADARAPAGLSEAFSGSAGRPGEGNCWDRESLRLDLLSEVRRKGNRDRILPPEPLRLRLLLDASGERGGLVGWVIVLFSIVILSLYAVDLRWDREVLQFFASCLRSNTIYKGGRFHSGQFHSNIRSRYECC
jgi:hypothetical protein